LCREGLSLAAYLALLQLGFTKPLVLPRVRWALTPPFHPYLAVETLLQTGRFVFCGTSRHGSPADSPHELLNRTMPRRYLAACPWSPDFPR